MGARSEFRSVDLSLDQRDQLRLLASQSSERLCDVLLQVFAGKGDRGEVVLRCQ